MHFTYTQQLQKMSKTDLVKAGLTALNELDHYAMRKIGEEIDRRNRIEAITERLGA